VSDWIQKAKDFVKGHPDQAQQGLDKVEQLINERTGGTHADKIDQGSDKLKETLGLPPDVEGTQPPGTPQPPPTPAPVPGPPPAPSPEPAPTPGPVPTPEPIPTPEPMQPVDPSDPAPVDPHLPGSSEGDITLGDPPARQG
jgi:hypothetical protein